MKNILNIPNTAINYLRLFKREIKKLEFLPKRYKQIEKGKINQIGVRKLVVKNYIVFYIVNDKENSVVIERILYGASNWINNL